MKQPAKQKAKYGFKKPKVNKNFKRILDPKINKAGFTQELIDQVIHKAAQERQQALVAEIYKRLEALGHVFEGETKDEDSKTFFRERLKIAKIDNNFYVYLDYVDSNNQGTLIIWYTENMEVEVKVDTKSTETKMVIT